MASKTNLNYFLRVLVSRLRNSIFFRSMATLSTKYLRVYFNEDHWDVDRNGEKYVLNCIGRSRKIRRIFDVGANLGQWVNMAISECDDTTEFHCFEVVPEIADRLRKTIPFDARDRVIINEIGLSNVEGRVDVHFDRHSFQGSYITAELEQSTEVQQCSVTTGDLYAKANGVELIDFVKIDVEGADFDVLMGFDALLSVRAIFAIQFEYTHMTYFKSGYMVDMITWLERRGYVVGRLYPEHVDFSVRRELSTLNFRNGNYLAVRNNDKALMRLLSHR